MKIAMSQEQVQKQAPKRVDPSVVKLSNAGLMAGSIQNKQPGLAYRLANPHCQFTGAPILLGGGWSEVPANGPERLVGGIKKDNCWFMQGMILLCRPKEDEDAHLAQKHSFMTQFEKERLGKEVSDLKIETVPVDAE
ncbi:MAG: hypothetical protein ACO3SP_09720 [Ilumatobacteraceae bacterium]